MADNQSIPPKQDAILSGYHVATPSRVPAKDFNMQKLSIAFWLVAGVALSIAGSQLLGIPNDITVFVKEKGNPEKGIPGVKCTLIMVSPIRKTEATSVTNEEGLAWFREIEDGVFNVFVEKKGYDVYLELENEQYIKYPIQEFEVKYERVQEGKVFLFYYLDKSVLNPVDNHGKKEENSGKEQDRK